MKLWLAGLLSLAAAKHSRELPQLEHSRAPAQANHADESLLVATADGVCHRLDSSSGAVLWSSGIPGGALLSSFQAPGEERLDQGNSGGRRGLSTTMIPAVGGTVLSHSGDGGLQAVGLSVSEMVNQTPKLAGDGNLYLGSKTSKLFGLRLADGADLSIDSTVGNGNGDAEDDESTPGVFFSRTDYTMRALNSRTRSELWNFTYSDVVPVADLVDGSSRDHGGDGTRNERSRSGASSKMVAISAPADGTLVPLCAASRHPEDEDGDDASFNEELDEAPCNDFAWEPGFAVPVVAAFVVQPPACIGRSGSACGEEGSRGGLRSEQPKKKALLPLSIRGSSSRSSSTHEGSSASLLGSALKQLPVRHTIFEPRHESPSTAAAGTAGTSVSVFQMDDGDWSADTEASTSVAATPSLYGVLYESSPSQLALDVLSHEEAAFVSRTSGEGSSSDVVTGRPPKHANPRLPRLPAKHKGAAAYRRALAINDDGSTSSSLVDQEHDLGWDELNHGELNERALQADAAAAVATARAVRAKWGNYSAQGVAAAAAAALAVSGRTRQHRSGVSDYYSASKAVAVGSEGDSSLSPRGLSNEHEDDESTFAVATSHARSKSSSHHALSQTLAASKRHAAALAALIVADDAGCASDSPAFPNCLIGLHVLEQPDDTSSGLDSGISNSIDSIGASKSTSKSTRGSSSSGSSTRDSNVDNSTDTSLWHSWLQLSMVVLSIVGVGLAFGGRARVLRVLLGLPDPVPPLPPPPTSTTKPGVGSQAADGAGVAMFAQDRKVDNDGDNDDKEGQRVTINSAGNVIAGQLEVSREVLGYGSMGTMVFRGMLGRGNEGLSSDKGASSSSSSGMKRGRPVAVKRLLQEYHHHAAREIRLLIESDGHPNVVRYFVQEAAGGFVYLALELCSMTLQDAIQRICRHRAPTRASAANAASATDANVLLSSIGLGSDAPAASSAVDPHSNAFANAAAGVDRSWVHLPPQDRAAALGALQEICDGVAYLHKQRIVHRDLKPMNILLAPRVGFAAAAAASSKKTAQMSLDDDSNQEPGADPVSVALAASRNELKTLADLRFFTLKISDMGLGKLLSPGQSSLGRSLGSVAHNSSRKKLHLTPPSSDGFGPPSTEASGGDIPSNESKAGNGGGGEGNSTGAAVGTTGWQAPEVLALRHQLWENASSSSSSSSANHEDNHYDGEGSDGINDVSNSAVVAQSSSLPHTSSSGGSGSGSGSRSGSITAAAGDLWSCGCVFFYVLTRGSHLFGDKWFEREANVVQGRAVGISKLDGAPEALDLVQRLTAMSPLQRPSAKAAQQHPFFWPPLKKLTFLVDLSDRLEQEPVGLSVVLAALESDVDLVVGRRGWHLRLDPLLLGDATKWRKYDVCSIRDLLRVLRNKRHHWNELPLEVRSNIEHAASVSSADSTATGAANHDSSSSSSGARDFTGAAFPEALLVYFERAFPLLLMHCFRVACACLHNDPTFAASYVGDYADHSQSKATEAAPSVAASLTHMKAPEPLRNGDGVTVGAVAAAGATGGLPQNTAPRVVSDRRLNAAAGEWKPAAGSSSGWLNASAQAATEPTLNVPSSTPTSHEVAEEAVDDSIEKEAEDIFAGSNGAAMQDVLEKATHTIANTAESTVSGTAAPSEFTASKMNVDLVSTTSEEVYSTPETTTATKSEAASVSSKPEEVPTPDSAASDEKVASVSAALEEMTASGTTLSEDATFAVGASPDQAVSAARGLEPVTEVDTLAVVASTELTSVVVPVETVEATALTSALSSDAAPAAPSALVSVSPPAPISTGALPAAVSAAPPPPPSEEFGHLAGVLVWAQTDAAAALGCRGWVRRSEHWLSAASNSSEQWCPWGGSVLRSSAKQAANSSSIEPLSALPGPLARAAEDFKFRTRLCQHWDSTRGTFCPIRRKGKCDFAHGPVELRVKPTRRDKWPHPCVPAASGPGSGSTAGGAPERGAAGTAAGTVAESGGGGRSGAGTTGSDSRAFLRLSGGEDVYGGARHVERIRRDEGKDEVEKQRRGGRGQPQRQTGRDR